MFGISLNRSFSFILSPSSHRESWEVSQVSDTPRDNYLEFKTLGCGPSQPCTGWVMCLSHRVLWLQTSETDSGRCKQSGIYYKDTGGSQNGQEAWKTWKQIETKVLSWVRPGGRNNRHSFRAKIVWSGLLGCDGWILPFSASVSIAHLEASMGHTPLPCEKGRSTLRPLHILVRGLAPGLIAS